MSPTISRRTLYARFTTTPLGYLHFDAAMTGLVLALVIAAASANSIEVARWLRSSVPAVFAPTETPSPARDAELAARRLTPAMRAALDYVVQRYHVSAEALQPAFHAAQLVGRERQIDPLLLIAVISIESRFNPFSQSAMGAQGLMQIIPRYHQDKVPVFAGAQPFLDPVINVQIGARILQESIRRNGGLMEGLQYYAGAVDDEEQTYANKVLAEKLRLEQAVRRREGATV